MLMHEEMLSVQEIANLLDVSEPTVFEWMQTGELQAYKRGGKWHVYRRDVESFIFRRDEVRWEEVNWRAI